MVLVAGIIVFGRFNIEKINHRWNVVMAVKHITGEWCKGDWGKKNTKEEHIDKEIEKKHSEDEKWKEKMEAKKKIVSCG
jgi:hypothetical protein